MSKPFDLMSYDLEVVTIQFRTCKGIVVLSCGEMEGMSVSVICIKVRSNIPSAEQDRALKINVAIEVVNVE